MNGGYIELVLGIINQLITGGGTTLYKWMMTGGAPSWLMKPPYRTVAKMWNIDIRKFMYSWSIGTFEFKITRNETRSVSFSKCQ